MLGAPRGSPSAMQQFAFLLSAVVCVVSALFIVTRKNPVYSVLFMLPFFLGMALLFVLLSAPFLAAMQLMVYGGAILVVFLFVIMLINLRPEELKDDFGMASWAAPAVCVGLLGGTLLCFALVGIPADSALEKGFAAPVAGYEEGPAFGSLNSLSLPLFRLFLAPFELVSLLIVVAILGAVMLSKKKV